MNKYLFSLLFLATISPELMHASDQKGWWQSKVNPDETGDEASRRSQATITLAVAALIEEERNPQPAQTVHELLEEYSKEAQKDSNKN